VSPQLKAVEIELIVRWQKVQQDCLDIELDELVRYSGNIEIWVLMMIRKRVWELVRWQYKILLRRKKGDKLERLLGEYFLLMDIVVQASNLLFLVT
jgi:uncharacterized membrane protein